MSIVPGLSKGRKVPSSYGFDVRDTAVRGGDIRFRAGVGGHVPGSRAGQASMVVAREALTAVRIPSALDALPSGAELVLVGAVSVVPASGAMGSPAAYEQKGQKHRRR